MAARVAIIGGGLAGMSAALSALERGWSPTLFESRPVLGGRAGVILDPALAQELDFCQHVALGCCTSFLNFCRRTGLFASLQRHTRIPLIGPNGRLRHLRPVTWLPAELQMLPSLLLLDYLSIGERISVARALRRLLHAPPQLATIGEWLGAQGAGARQRDRFWSFLVESALSETLDRASLAAAQFFFTKGFMGGADNSSIYVATQPLGWLLRQLADTLRLGGADVRLRSRVLQIAPTAREVAVTLHGAVERFDAVVVAVPWRQAAALIEPLRGKTPPWAALEGSPITAVHLWFDREVLDWPLLALPGRFSQWVFRTSGAAPSECATVATEETSRKARAGKASFGVATSPLAEAPASAGGAAPAVRASTSPTSYVQVVISAAHGVARNDRNTVVKRVCKDLAAVLPSVREAVLVHSRVMTHEHAVFAPLPHTDRVRPDQETPITGIFLAGDWTATGWPATMEGAVRSGELAIAALANRYD